MFLSRVERFLETFNDKILRANTIGEKKKIKMLKNNDASSLN